MGCYEQNSPSSVLSPWLIDMDPPAPLGSLEEALTSSSSSLKRPASPASNSSSKDRTVTRVSKRRRKSRAHLKVPVTQLSANKLNFKDIVHQFTGNPKPPPPSANFRKDASPCNTNMPAVDAQTAANSQSHVLLARLAQSLSVLETICAHFLLDGSPTKMQNQLHNSCKSLSSLQALIDEPQAQEIETQRELPPPANMLDVDLQYKAQELERFLLGGNDP